MVQKLLRINEKYIEKHSTSGNNKVYWVRIEEITMDKDVSQSSGSGSRLHNVDNNHWRLSLEYRLKLNLRMVRNQCESVEWTSRVDSFRSIISIKKDSSCFDYSGCALSRHSLRIADMWGDNRFQMASTTQILQYKWKRPCTSSSIRTILWLRVSRSNDSTSNNSSNRQMLDNYHRCFAYQIGSQSCRTSWYR